MINPAQHREEQSHSSVNHLPPGAVLRNMAVSGKWDGKQQVVATNLGDALQFLESMEHFVDNLETMDNSNVRAVQKQKR